MQKSLIVRDDSMSNNELNDYLEDGWRVYQTCAMPSSVASNIYSAIRPTCLVIIEKDN